uniref:Uncharacterized protein n=1 Tax=Octopus bimaculoides TaxID=37653 RepID=A0A0L8H894_OCTBM
MYVCVLYMYVNVIEKRRRGKEADEKYLPRQFQLVTQPTISANLLHPIAIVVVYPVLFGSCYKNCKRGVIGLLKLKLRCKRRTYI